VNLTVDIGNTTIKFVVFDSSNIVARYNIAHDDVFDIQDLINTYSIQNSIISTVTNSEFPWMSLLTTSTHCIRLNHAMRIPFTSSYLPFKQLGLDRVVGLAAATKLFPEKDVLIIDAGTCITYDLINAQAHHLGGSISPGLGMRYRAMNEFTDALPKLDVNSPSAFPPSNTQEAIHHGVIDGTCAEINAFIAQYTQALSKFKVILTGGDANFLAERLKNGIFAHVDFLAHGLNALLELNLIE
jgi:type III pantothenate kinase